MDHVIGEYVMNIFRCLETLGGAAVLATALTWPAAAETAKATLHDKSGKDVGLVELSQTPAGVLLKLSLKGLPAG
jgi:Cu-Zn family superoxide dismutase